MIGDKIKVLDELHLATVSLMPENESQREVLEYFLVKPVVKTSIFGKSKLIGYNEAVTGIRTCNLKDVYCVVGDIEGFEPCLVDAESESCFEVGDVNWDVDELKTADEVCKEGNIERYFKFADFDIAGRIEYVREQSKAKKEEKKIDIFKLRERSKQD